MTATPLTPTTFHDALFAERERMGLTQAELADKLSTSQQNIASWESGRTAPRRRTLSRITEFFGPDSPVTKLAPTNDDPPMSPEPLRSSLFRKEPEMRGIAASRVRSEMIEPPPDLVTLVPENFRTYVEAAIQVGSRTARADYWSPKLGLEIIWMRQSGLLNPALPRTRQAMQQLLVFNKADPSPERRLAVVVVSQDTALLQGNVLERIYIESSLLDINVIFTNTAEGVVHTITEYEQGDPTVFDQESD